MRQTTWIAVFVILSVSNVVYAQQHDTRAGPPQSILPRPRIEQGQELPELKRQAHVGSQQFAPQRDNAWVEQSLNLGLDQSKLGCKIIAYRIQWFNGQWSGWFVPGVNDLYKKSSEPLRRYWACFNDHSFEIIYMADQHIDFSKRKTGHIQQ